MVGQHDACLPFRVGRDEMVRREGPETLRIVACKRLHGRVPQRGEVRFCVGSHARMALGSVPETQGQAFLVLPGGWRPSADAVSEITISDSSTASARMASR